MAATFVIIGAMKSGTSTVRQHLRTHPEVSMARLNEPNFFYGEGNWSKGTAWYARQFDMSKSIRGDSSPNYSKAGTFPGVPERMHQLIPSARLVYVLRDPILRLVSHFSHNLAQGREMRTMEEVFDGASTNGYIDTSLYFRQLSEFLRYFEAKDILLVTTEALAENPEGVMRQIFTHIGADPSHTPPKLGRVFHRGDVKRRPSALTRPLVNAPGGRFLRRIVGPLMERPMERQILSAAVRERLLQSIGPDVDALRDFSGRSFDRWSL